MEKIIKILENISIGSCICFLVWLIIVFIVSPIFVFIVSPSCKALLDISKVPYDIRDIRDATRDIRNQMQAEKEQKEIDARADEIVKDYMQKRKKLLKEVGSERNADSAIKEWDSMLGKLREKADYGDKVSQRALIKMAFVE